MVLSGLLPNLDVMTQYVLEKKTPKLTTKAYMCGWFYFNHFPCAGYDPLCCNPLLRWSFSRFFKTLPGDKTANIFLLTRWVGPTFPLDPMGGAHIL